MLRNRLRSFGLLAYWEILLPLVLLGALVLSAAADSPGSPLRTASRGVAVLLLLAVTGASLQLGVQRRAATRHDSIRADIAAAGGLGKRLTV